MKKKYLPVCYLFIVFLLITTTKVFSQSKNKITWGIHVGANLSNITLKGFQTNGNSSSIYNYNYKVGFNGGVDFQLPILHSIILQPELSFSQLGAKAKSNENAPGSLVDNDQKLNEDYLVLPVLIKYTAPRLPGFAVYAGPQYGYLLSAVGSNPTNDNSSASTTFTDEFHSSDFSAILGIEYYCKKGLGVSGRYQLGLTNDVTDVVIYHGSMKNRSFTVTVGYRF